MRLGCDMLLDRFLNAHQEEVGFVDVHFICLCECGGNKGGGSCSEYDLVLEFISLRRNVWSLEW